MSLNGADFWNKLTTQLVEEGVLSLESGLLIESLSQRIEQLVEGQIHDVQKVAESVSHKVGSLLADLYGEELDIDGLVQAMAILTDATCDALQRRTSLGFQEAVQSQIRILLSGIKTTLESSKKPDSHEQRIEAMEPEPISAAVVEEVGARSNLPALVKSPVKIAKKTAPKVIISDSGDVLADEKEAENRAREGGYEGPFKSYMKGATKYSLLTRQEESDLSHQMKHGETEIVRDKAREKMIVSNLRLVVKIAFDYKNYGMAIDDLIQEGNIGLMKAIERFDSNYGAKLSTYAAWWIKQSIKRALANQSRDIRLPVHMVDKIAKMRRASHAMSEELGREPSDDELAEELGMDRGKLYLLRTSGIRPASLDSPIGEDGDTTLGEIVGDESGVDASAALISADLLGKIEGLMKLLDERETEIIERRYGLNGYKAQTLEEVGEHFGVTRERIRQLQNIALEKMRRKLGKMEKVLPDTVKSNEKKGSKKPIKQTKKPLIRPAEPEKKPPVETGVIILDGDTRFMLKHAKNGTAGMRPNMSLAEIAVEVGLSPEDTRATLIDMGLLSQ